MAALLPINTAPPNFTPAPITDEEARAMFSAAVNLFRLWSVTDEEAAILLDLPVRSYRRWKAGDIGRIVTEQNRTDQRFFFAAQLRDDARPFIILHHQLVNSPARYGGHRGFCC